MLRTIIKSICMIFILALFMIGFIARTSKSGMIGTETAVYFAKKKNCRSMVTAFLERKDVQLAMERQGVDVYEARKRVKALSDQEIMKIVHKIDQLPAGGDAR